MRYCPDSNRQEYYQTYRYRMTRPMTVQECLLALQDEQDSTLSFRYACRRAICGSCAMCINGKPRLACKTQIINIPTNQILIEPLPNFEVIKDLVVDMTPFWEALNRIEPWLQNDSPPPEKERLVSPKCMDKLDRYINCILCAACYGACTVPGRDRGYLGPAAIAKLFRFLEDPRDRRDLALLDRLNNKNGLWGCNTLFRCIDACPKDVRPADAIAAVRRKIFIYKIKKLFRLVR